MPGEQLALLAIGAVPGVLSGWLAYKQATRAARATEVLEASKLGIEASKVRFEATDSLVARLESEVKWLTGQLADTRTALGEAQVEILALRRQVNELGKG